MNTQENHILGGDFYKTLLDSLFDAVFTVDTDGQIQYWNHACERLTGYNSEVIMGQHYGTLSIDSSDESTDPAVYPRGPITPGGVLHRLLDDYPNLWADLSAGSALTAISRDVDHGRDFILRHQDRLMFGRDADGNRLQEFLPTLDLPPEVMDKIRCENALKLVPVDA